MTRQLVSLSELSDEMPRDAYPRPGCTLSSVSCSPRLDAVLSRVPSKHSRTRLTNVLYNNGVCTVAQLCTKRRAEMKRWKNIGKRSIADLEAALALFELSLAKALNRNSSTAPPVKQDKPQTSAQRIANPVWLRQQISQLVADCDENIAEDQALADKARDDARRNGYLERVATHRHWKRQIQRLLRGKTFAEDICDPGNSTREARP